VLLIIVQYTFLLCTRTTLTSASLSSLFTSADIERSGKHVCTPLHSLHSAAALVGGSNVTFTLSFYTLNTFIILSVLNISMSYSLLNICLFPFLNKSHAETKVIMFGVFQLVFNSKDRNRLRSPISSRHRNKLQTEFLRSAADVGHVLKRDARHDLLGCRVKLCSDSTWTE
jgi:hypothetical protein